MTKCNKALSLANLGACVHLIQNFRFGGQEISKKQFILCYFQHMRYSTLLLCLPSTDKGHFENERAILYLHCGVKIST